MTTGAAETDLSSFLDRARALCEAEDFDAAAKLAVERFGDETPPGAALLVRAIAAFHGGDLAEAARLVNWAQDVEPREGVHCEALSVILARAGDLHGSTYQRKNASSLAQAEAMKAFLAFLPDFTTAYLGITNRPLMARGRAAFLSGDLDEAEACFAQHIYFEPSNREAHLALAQARSMRDDPWSAIDYLRAAAHCITDDAAVMSALGLALAETAAFPDALACHRRAELLAPADGYVAAMHLLDRLRDPGQSPAGLARAAADWGRRFGVTVADQPPRAVDKPRRTIAYIVGSRAMTPAGKALAQVIGRHDPRKFRVLGFGLGALTQPYNIPLQSCFDRWQDIAGLEPHTVRAMLKAEGVDILVFADGLHDPGTLAILGSRIAPVQVVWGGLPYGTGLAQVDALVSDAVVDAGEGDAADRVALLDVPAALVQLPSADLPLGPGTDGSAVHLTFAADCANWEINPATVEWWAAALHAVPNAVLVLKDNGLSAPRSVDRLVALFGNFGLAHRIDVVAGQSRADLFADVDLVLGALPASAPQVVVDALWSGAPVICPMGAGRHAREAASVLHALGFGESMVATSAQAFGALAKSWADDVDGRKALRAGIRTRLSSARALDSQAICASFEAALDTLWQPAKAPA